MTVDFPKLRSLDLRPVQYEGHPYLLVRDPLQLTDQTLLLPQPLASALAFMDGTWDPVQISREIGKYTGLRLGRGDIEQLINTLDLSLLLENERSHMAQQRALKAYREAPFRKPALAGDSYPEDRREFQEYLQNFVDVSAVNATAGAATSITGLVSPHIDYPRGGEVYARAWMAVANSVRQADLAVILGTDHYGTAKDLTLTRQQYATPLGALPTALEIVESLAAEIGQSRAFAGELRHLGEHSIELAAGWLHFVRGGAPIELVPILCGPFQEFIESGTHPDADPELQRWLRKLANRISSRNVVVIAAGDLSHVGTAFGGEPLVLETASQVRDTDQMLIDHICNGDAHRFFQTIAAAGDQNNVCGLAPIYLALRLLDPVEGHQVAYERCPADESGGSLVSICGISLHNVGESVS